MKTKGETMKAAMTKPIRLTNYECMLARTAIDALMAANSMLAEHPTTLGNPNAAAVYDDANRDLAALREKLRL